VGEDFSWVETHVLFCCPEGERRSWKVPELRREICSQVQGLAGRSVHLGNESARF